MTTAAAPHVRPVDPPATPRPGRVYNFSAGPACMPESVLDQLREELVDFRGTGIGLLEHSHRGPSYDQMLAEAVEAVRQAFAGKPAELHVYPGSLHGFNCWARASYHAPSAALALGRSLQFLAQALF